MQIAEALMEVIHGPGNCHNGVHYGRPTWQDSRNWTLESRVR